MIPSWNASPSRGSSTAPWNSTRTLSRLNEEKAGVFVTINKTDGCGRMAENIIRVRAVFADLDGTPLPESWELEPHVITASSPGRYHTYWGVSDCPLERFTAVQKAIATRFKGALWCVI